MIIASRVSRRRGQNSKLAQAGAMDSYNSENLSFSPDGSQLLDLSPVLPPESSPSDIGQEEDDDLSLSDLSLDQTIRMRAPFSLLSKHPTTLDAETPTRPEPAKSSSRLVDPDERDLIRDEEDHEDEEGAKRRATKLREEKLQSDIFVLKKLNSSFAAFNEALDGTGSANKRVAAQLAETDALLNKYLNMLSQTEQVARLIFDEEWYGAEADEEQIELERIEQEQKALQAAREQAAFAQREAERREREERERMEREEKEMLERQKRERMAARGGVRGVRGTRASMRGTRAAAPPRPESSTSTRARQSVATATSSGIPTKRGTPPTSGIGRPSTTSRGSSSRRF